MKRSVPFALFYANEGYSTASRLMGRQAAGQSLLKGLARTWPDAPLRAIGNRASEAESLQQQLRGDGFHGQLDWTSVPDFGAAQLAGALYYPAPLPRALAAARNGRHPAAFSLIGITHSLSTNDASRLVEDMLLPPFKPWDALICTSSAARELVGKLHDGIREYWTAQTGASRFVDLSLPVIPLGINVEDYRPDPGARASARAHWHIAADEVVFLSAGRLAFHAKGNPAPAYRALEQAARVAPVVCIESGIFPNQAARDAYTATQRAIAPSVRFIWVDGADADAYRKSWHAADVFFSVADNIQETFGLTPVEAMAAGLPVVVADWSGYRDTVQDGVVGFRIPTFLPHRGGAQLALRHAMQSLSYDRYIGAVSLATVVEPESLARAFASLAASPELRARMGAAGRERAAEFDWPRILEQYAQLAAQLEESRAAAGREREPHPMCADPFGQYAHFATATMAPEWRISAGADAAPRLAPLMDLFVTHYAFNDRGESLAQLQRLLGILGGSAQHSVKSLLDEAGLNNGTGVRLLMWLWKFDLVRVSRSA